MCVKINVSSKFSPTSYVQEITRTLERSFNF